MSTPLGFLRVRVNRGVNLAVRDFNSSDPYVVIKIGRTKLKTRVIKKNLNPQWNEDFTLSVLDPNLPIRLTVYDHDLFSRDDKMGDAEFDVKPLLEAMRLDLKGLPSGTVLARVQPSKHKNCLADESCIKYIDGKFCQDLILRLRNVECGELELSLNWIVDTHV
ncbi:protein C2-DOMAIN ABA-RELATED 4-like [Impatiens glandulifera]|uniref:protein C2-DOMAIN ABA-RELATED 4-like n=1 Tax=Impatiens glandulifera TaxID=253017 RepID=UPI001FB19517|nr:protein C2-DOMAIN ABA-RELATED 4-like [Impatiens glandulifera]